MCLSPNDSHGIFSSLADLTCGKWCLDIDIIQWVCQYYFQNMVDVMPRTILNVSKCHRQKTVETANSYRLWLLPKIFTDYSYSHKSLQISVTLKSIHTMIALKSATNMHQVMCAMMTWTYNHAAILHQSANENQNM